jgi:hypothetical protein
MRMKNGQKCGRLIASGGAGVGARAERSERVERSEWAERSERAERSEWAEQSERAEQSEHERSEVSGAHEADVTELISRHDTRLAGGKIGA